MPSRWIVAAVLAFWIGMTSWYAVRERLFPWLREDAPAAFRVELTDEIGVSSVHWKVLFQQQPVGQGRTETKMLPDRTFELSSHFRFDRFAPVKGVDIRLVQTAFRVDRQGNLLGLSAKVSLETLGVLPVVLELDDAVSEGKLTVHPKVTVSGQSANVPPMPPIDMTKRGSILNPMHPMHRLPGLRVGQRWRMPLFDPLTAASSAPGIAQLAGRGPTELEAEVVAADFEWNGEAVPTFKIEYRDPGKDRIVAGTWVRRSDDFVLQQWALHDGYELTLVRQK